MHDIARWSPQERAKLFEAASDKLRLHPSIVEKDFWVCCVLDLLFQSMEWGTHLMFKGGTCLSKVFGLINRFSEDIDLILDWNLIGYTAETTWQERSRTQDDFFSSKMNQAASGFLNSRFLPSLNGIISKSHIDGVSAVIDEKDSKSVIIYYPYSFKMGYIKSEVRLEIGPLAAWVPHGEFSIKPYAVDITPKFFKQPQGRVRAILAERTFWEKATILHREANRPENSAMPARYSRHYYDMAMMADKLVKSNALKDRALLESVVAFKQKFYSCKWAHYDQAKPGTLRLMPPPSSMIILEADYEAMKEMIFNDAPSFEWVMGQVHELESEINS